MSENPPVTSVVVRKFRATSKEAANDALLRLEATLHNQPGFIGIQHSTPNMDRSGEFATVVSFRTVDDLLAWERSEERNDIVAELRNYTEGEVVGNRFWGLITPTTKSDSSQKWKVVVILVLWILCLGEILGRIADLASPDFPQGYPRYAMLLIINVVLISYFFLPKSMTLFENLEARAMAFWRATKGAHR